MTPPRPISVPLLVSFESPHGAVWIDPLAVDTVERALIDDSGTRLVTKSGGNYNLSAEPDSVAKIVNDARTAIAQARGDGA